MTTQDEGQDESQSRLLAQVGLMLSGIPGVVDGLEGAVAHPADWAERGGWTTTIANAPCWFVTRTSIA